MFILDADHISLFQRRDPHVTGRVLATPALELATTEEEVLRKAQADLQSLLVGGRIIQLDLDAKPEGHPWQQFAGMFADDPDWEWLPLRNNCEAVWIGCAGLEAM